MPRLPILLVLLFVPLATMPILQLQCHNGQRVHTPANQGTDICKACSPGTFNNLNLHSERECFNCSTCPDFVGRKCTLTNDTVCCPISNMTVIDTEAGQYCAISANARLTNYTITIDDNTHQIVKHGGNQNGSDNEDVRKADKDYVSCVGYTLATIVITYLVLFHNSRPRWTCYEKAFVIVGVMLILIHTVLFFVLGDDVSKILFLVFISLSVVYCVVYEFHRYFPSFMNSCIRKLRNVAGGLYVPVSAPAPLYQDDNNVPECQPSDSLITDSNNQGSELTLNFQDCPSLSPDDTFDYNDSGSYVHVATVGRSPGHSTDELVSEHGSHDVSRQHASLPTANAENVYGSSEPLLVGQSGQTNGKMFGIAEVSGSAEHDTSIHSEASVSPPTNRYLVTTVPILLTSGSGDNHTDKAGESGYTPGEVEEEDTGAGDTELSREQLALNMRI